MKEIYMIDTSRDRFFISTDKPMLGMEKRTFYEQVFCILPEIDFHFTKPTKLVFMQNDIKEKVVIMLCVT